MSRIRNNFWIRWSSNTLHMLECVWKIKHGVHCTMKSIKEICSFVKGEIFLKRDISFNRPVFWLLSEVFRQRLPHLPALSTFAVEPVWRRDVRKMYDGLYPITSTLIHNDHHYLEPIISPKWVGRAKFWEAITTQVIAKQNWQISRNMK